MRGSGRWDGSLIDRGYERRVGGGASHDSPRIDRYLPNEERES